MFIVKTDFSTAKPVLPLPCACATLRRATRVVSALYSSALQPAGLTVAQFTLLQVLDVKAPLRQGELGDVLAMDSTTLTRTLGLLRKQGLIRIVPGKDRRERYIALTSLGQQKLALAKPLWREVQGKLWVRLGDESWKKLGELLNGVIGAAISS